MVRKRGPTRVKNCITFLYIIDWIVKVLLGISNKCTRLLLYYFVFLCTMRGYVHQQNIFGYYLILRVAKNVLVLKCKTVADTPPPFCTKYSTNKTVIVAHLTCIRNAVTILEICISTFNVKSKNCLFLYRKPFFFC